METRWTVESTRGGVSERVVEVVCLSSANEIHCNGLHMDKLHLTNRKGNLSTLVQVVMISSVILISIITMSSESPSSYYVR